MRIRFGCGLDSRIYGIYWPVTSVASSCGCFNESLFQKLFFHVSWLCMLSGFAFLIWVSTWPCLDDPGWGVRGKRQQVFVSKVGLSLGVVIPSSTSSRSWENKLCCNHTLVVWTQEMSSGKCYDEKIQYYILWMGPEIHMFKEYITWLYLVLTDRHKMKLEVINYICCWSIGHAT